MISSDHLRSDIKEQAVGPVPEVMATSERAAGLPDLRAATQAYQRILIRQALEAQSGNWAAAARSLGMHRSNLHHLAVRLGLK